MLLNKKNHTDQLQSIDKNKFGSYLELYEKISDNRFPWGSFISEALLSQIPIGKKNVVDLLEELMRMNKCRMINPVISEKYDEKKHRIEHNGEKNESGVGEKWKRAEYVVSKVIQIGMATSTGHTLEKAIVEVEPKTEDIVDSSSVFFKSQVNKDLLR